MIAERWLSRRLWSAPAAKGGAGPFGMPVGSLGTRFLPEPHRRRFRTADKAGTFVIFRDRNPCLLVR